MTLSELKTDLVNALYNLCTQIVDGNIRIDQTVIDNAEYILSEYLEYEDLLSVDDILQEIQELYDMM